MHQALICSSDSIFESLFYWWGEKDSNLRTPKRTDLQSGAVGHLATSPYLLKILLLKNASRRRDSNPRPADYKSAALPAELLRLFLFCLVHQSLMTYPSKKVCKCRKEIIPTKQFLQNKIRK